MSYNIISVAQAKTYRNDIMEIYRNEMAKYVNTRINTQLENLDDSFEVIITKKELWDKVGNGKPLINKMIWFDLISPIVIELRSKEFSCKFADDHIKITYEF